MDFNSEYKPIKFNKQIEVFYKNEYGYVPVVFVFAERISPDVKIPLFTICQAYLDEYKQWHNYFDRFVLLTEKYKKGTIKFHYKVMDWKNKVTESGRIKKKNIPFEQKCKKMTVIFREDTGQGRFV
jgi:hypothetical protein